MALTTSTKSSSTRPKLLDQVRAMVRVVKHYSYRTEQAYVYLIRRFSLFHNIKEMVANKTILVRINHEERDLTREGR